MQEKETAALDTNTLRHQFQELQERASKDALSGLLNRQTAESYISARLKEMTAEQTCALFIIDLDHFKQVNDTLGHQAGDWAIRQSAKALSGLFLGKSETAGEYVSLFKPVCSAEKIYIHKGEGKVEDLAPPTFTIPNIHALSLRSPSTAIGQPENSTAESLYLKCMEKFMPASVVLDEDDTVLHFFGNYADYLTIAPGKATLNFFSMLHKDLSLVATTALSRSRLEHSPVTYTDVVVDCGNERRTIDLVVQPVPDTENEEQNKLTAVLFLEDRKAETGGIREKYDIDATAARRIAELEREFQMSQSDLRATIQRLETVNGELQAANEELLTANEELQSSTE